MSRVPKASRKNFSGRVPLPLGPTIFATSIVTPNEWDDQKTERTVASPWALLPRHFASPANAGKCSWPERCVTYVSVSSKEISGIYGWGSIGIWLGVPLGVSVQTRHPHLRGQLYLIRALA